MEVWVLKCLSFVKNFTDCNLVPQLQQKNFFWAIKEVSGHEHTNYSHFNLEVPFLEEEL